MEADLKWLEDPEVFRVNRLEAHSDHIYFETMDDMMNNRRRLTQCLNGMWKFTWSVCPADRPKEFFKNLLKIMTGTSSKSSQAILSCRVLIRSTILIPTGRPTQRSGGHPQKKTREWIPHQKRPVVQRRPVHPLYRMAYQ